MLQILIGVLFIGLAAASPKPAPKAAPKPSHQYFETYPGAQPSYYPGASAYFGQQFAAQSILGQHAAGHYDARILPSPYGNAFGNAFVAQQAYSQAAEGNYYQSPMIPVPVAYAGGPSYNVQPADYYGAARLWSKGLISPAGSPSPVPDNYAQAYYAASTPSPFAYQSAASLPVTTPSPIPVPVKVASRTSFTPDINYNAARLTVPVSTPATYVPNYQQYATLTPYVQKQHTGFSFSTTSSPYVAKYQQPAIRYPVNYQSTPAPFQANYQHSSLSPQVHFHSTPAPPAQVTYKYQQQSTPTYYPAQPSSAPYQFKYQYPPVSSHSPFAAYNLPSVSPYIAQYQQQSESPFGAYYQSTASPFSTNYQRIPVPVAYPQYQAQSIHPSVSYPVTSKPITVLPTSPSPVKTVSITENTFIPFPTTPTPIGKPSATIIKSEYNPGNVSPQYNHVYSTPSPFASVTNAYLPQYAGKTYQSYAPSSAYAYYSPSTAVSHVSFNGLGQSYSY